MWFQIQTDQSLKGRQRYSKLWCSLPADHFPTGLGTEPDTPSFPVVSATALPLRPTLNKEWHSPPPRQLIHCSLHVEKLRQSRQMVELGCDCSLTLLTGWTFCGFHEKPSLSLSAPASSASTQTPFSLIAAVTSTRATSLSRQDFHNCCFGFCFEIGFL